MAISLSPYPEQTRGQGNIRDKDFKYRYPIGMNLKPGSDLHEKIKDAILIRARESRSAMSARYDSWQQIDKTLTAFIPLDEYEDALQAKDERKPVSIVVPLSYAALETILSYQVAAFLESPIFRYTGMGGSEDVLGAMLMEKLIDQQANRSLMGLQLHTMLRDSSAYGFGVCTPMWTQRTGWKRQRRQQGFNSLTGEFVSTGMDVVRERAIVYEGNELYSIDPYNYLPDVNCAIQDVQRSEYVGWIRSDSRMNLLRQEITDPVIFFNGKYLEFIGGKSVLTTEEASVRDRYGVSQGSPFNAMTTHKIDVIYMYVDLIPKEWGIGLHTNAEKWMFALAGDEVVIAASPLDLDHGMFPVVVCSPEFDGYSVSPISRVEMSYGLQKAIDFEFNSRLANVRKSLNDMFVLDPQRVNINDVRNPGPGKIIRLRKQAWGSGVQGALEQLKVLDVTSNNFADASHITSILDRVMGSESSIQGGIQRHGERITATEFQGYRGAALTRLERAAKVAALQAINPLGMMVASHTQQFMTQEQYVAIAGEYEEELRAEFGDQSHVLVGPLDIAVSYDLRMHDGSLPSAGDPNAWNMMFQTIASNPQLASYFDVVRIFQHWARLAGAKDLSRFVNQKARVMQDEAVRQQVQAGNLVPMEASGGLPGMQQAAGERV
jgi:hypothetical protein